MYTIKIDKTNHTVTIINNLTKRGITMRNIGDEMAIFLRVLVAGANKPSFERETEEYVIIEGKWYRALTDEESVKCIWGKESETEHVEDRSSHVD